MTQILTHKPKGRRLDFRQATLGAAEMREVPAWRIALEVMALARSQGRLTADDYFLQGAWRPGLTWTERRAFVGTRVNSAVNLALNPPITDAARQITQDKLGATRRFEAAGLPVPRTMAVAAQGDPGDGLRWLDGPEAIAAYIRAPGTLPCFGKPVHGSTGVGAVWLDRLDEAGQVQLNDGRVVSVEALVAEIWASHARGYLFQEILAPHPALARLIGPVIGTLRVLTIDAGNGPEVLYTGLKTPAPGAVVDSAAGPLGCYAAIDAASGKVLRLQDRRRLGGTDEAVNPITGVAMAGHILPDFAQALQIAVAAHGCIPDRGILGVDIMLSDGGPRVMEVNTSPHNSLYQTAFGLGLLSAEFLPRLQAVRARYRAVTPRPKYSPLK